MALLASVPVRSVEQLHRLLGFHVRSCVDDLRRTGARPLYSAGVRYRVEAPGRERWQLPSETRRIGYGDCEDLASYRAADLRFSGEDPAAEVVTYQSAPNVRHCIVRRSNGRTEDPSRALGMGSERDHRERAEMRGLGVATMPEPTGVRWSVRRVGAHGWEGEVILTLDPGLRQRLNLAGYSTGADAPPAGICVRARGRSRGDAATRTMAAVSSIVSSPLVQAMLPPGAMLALRAAQKVAKLFRGLFRKKRRRHTVSGLEVTPRYVAQALGARGLDANLVRYAEVCGDW